MTYPLAGEQRVGNGNENMDEDMEANDSQYHGYFNMSERMMNEMVKKNRSHYQRAA